MVIWAKYKEYFFGYTGSLVFRRVAENESFRRRTFCWNVEGIKWLDRCVD